MGKWLLPENVADILPAEARRIENLRRHLLDLYRVHGYELVMPPLVEYLDSLLSGTRRDLDLSTFKLVDQISGRTLGLRADMTPQVARIDAHLLNRAGITRLCYFGSVLHTKPMGLFASREPLQIGAELYGYAGYQADAEIIKLALHSVVSTGLQGARLDLSHPGVVRAVIDADPAAIPLADEIYDLLRNKDIPTLTELIAHLSVDTQHALLALPTLYGDVDVLARAAQVLPNTPQIAQALNDLHLIIADLGPVNLGIDLADVPGYQYHSGVTFGVYCADWPNAVVRGGRYDDIGSAYGRARPATGFSMDLRVLAGLLVPATASSAICAPWVESDAALRQKVSQLRAQGEIVVQLFPQQEQVHDEFICDRILKLVNGQWQVVQVKL